MKGFYIGFRPFDSSGQFQYKTIEFDEKKSKNDVTSGSNEFTSGRSKQEQPVTQVQLNGLRPFTRYQLIVQAFNSAGTGPRSEPITAATAEDSKLNKTNFFSINTIFKHFFHFWLLNKNKLLTKYIYFFCSNKNVRCFFFFINTFNIQNFLLLSHMLLLLLILFLFQFKAFLHKNFQTKQFAFYEHDFPLIAPSLFMQLLH